MEHKIDAKGKSLGRVATEVAQLLLGKDMPATFKRNAVTNNTVHVVNASGMTIDAKKLKQKTYHSHSGYPGGDRKRTLSEVITKKGHKDALVRAINGMLPKNTLREKRLKQLLIED